MKNSKDEKKASLAGRPGRSGRILSLLFVVFFCLPASAALGHQMRNYEFTGLEYIKYYLTVWWSAFAGFPFVVKVSVLIIVCSIVIIALIALQMVIAMYRDRKREAFYNEIDERYHDVFTEIICSDQHCNKARVRELIGPVPPKWKGWRMLYVGRLITHVKYENYDKFNNPNTQNLITVTGLRNFLEKNMTFGSLSNRLLSMEQVYFLLINLPESILVRLLSSKDSTLRKQVRLYYIYLSDFNPFRFITDENVNAEHRPVDEMELHVLLQARKKNGKEMPSLVPIVERANDPNARAAMIREVAFWGTPQDVQQMFKYIKSRHDTVRRAAIHCVSIARDVRGEKVLMDQFDLLTESLKARAAYAIFRVMSGKAVPFYVEQYKKSKVAITRIKLLLCLKCYSEEGLKAFQALEAAAATEADRLTFGQVRVLSRRFNDIVQYID